MKKLFLYAVAAFAMFATACSQDAAVVNPDSELGVVTFSVNTPEMATRSISDGKTATDLTVTVYEKDANGSYVQLEQLTKTATFSNLQAEVDFRLVTGKTYCFAFWAQAPDATAYTFDEASATVNINYAGCKANDENHDAFFASRHDLKVEGAINETITLNRPFAQLNVATADWAEANASELNVKTTNLVVVENVYTSLNLLDGEVSNPITAELSFAHNNIPEGDLTGHDGYKWLSMNYLLVNEKELTQVRMATNDGDVAEKNWANVPLQRNYRTNILGNILTSAVDFNIVIDPIFDGDLEPEVTATVATVAELKDVIATATEPIVVELEAGTYEFDKIEIGSSKSITLKEAPVAASTATRAETGITLNGQFFVTGELYIDGATISNEKATTSGNSKQKDNAIYVQSEGKVVVTNSTFNIAKATAITSWWSTGKQTNIIVKNCVFNANGNRPIQAEANLTVENCTFNDPYRYCAQLTCADAVINFKNNTINQAMTSGKATYGLQLTCDYGNRNLVINGEGNVINGRGDDDALYVWEYGTGISNGVVDINTITLNATDGEFYVLDGDTFAIAINDLEDLKAFAADVNGGNTFAKKNVILLNDIDLANAEWTPIGNSSAKFQGNFDGKNHTISNLLINAEGKSYIGLFGNTNSGSIKNLTVENAQVKGYCNVGVVAGNPYTSKYENITVKGLVQVDGLAYVGGVGGKNAYANWTNVTVDVEEGSYVKGYSIENGTAYCTYVGGVVGFMGEGGHTFENVTSNIDVYGSTCDVGGIVGIAHYDNSFVNCKSSGNVTITDAAEAADAEEMGGIAGVWHNATGHKVTFTGCEYTGKLSANITEGVDLSDNTIVGKAYSATGEGVLVIDGKQYVTTTDVANIDTAAKSGGDVTLSGDVTASANDTTANSGYGATGVQVAGGTLDLGGHTLTVTNAAGTWGCAVNTVGGTIKNGTVKGAMRGIFMGGANADVYIDNVVFEDVVYTFNSDGGNKNYGVYISNCTINGWTSHSDVHKEVVYTNCTFGEGSGYAFCRPYGPTVYENCEFSTDMEFDATRQASLVFKNCTYGGVKITAENAASLKTGDVVFFYNGVGSASFE